VPPGEETQSHLINSPPEHLIGRLYEAYIALIFTSLGYHVTSTRATGDFGADLLIYSSDEKSSELLYVVECKWRTDQPIGIDVIGQVLTGQKYYSAPKAIIATNSKLTPQAREAAEKADITFLHAGFKAWEDLRDNPKAYKGIWLVKPFTPPEIDFFEARELAKKAVCKDMGLSSIPSNYEFEVSFNYFGAFDDGPTLGFLQYSLNVAVLVPNRWLPFLIGPKLQYNVGIDARNGKVIKLNKVVREAQQDDNEREEDDADE
jgi:hypothetical protein